MKLNISQFITILSISSTISIIKEEIERFSLKSYDANSVSFPYTKLIIYNEKSISKGTFSFGFEPLLRPKFQLYKEDQIFVDHDRSFFRKTTSPPNVNIPLQNGLLTLKKDTGGALVSIDYCFYMNHTTRSPTVYDKYEHFCLNVIFKQDLEPENRDRLQYELEIFYKDSEGSEA
jgi:hypothetical protein